MTKVFKRLLERRRAARMIPYLRRLERKSPPVPVPLEICSRFAVQWRQNIGDPHKKMWTHGLYNRGKSSITSTEDGGPQWYSDALARRLIQVMPSRKGDTIVHHMDFWELQWGKHGCVFGVTVEGYFYIIIYLHDHLPDDVRDMGLKPGIQSTTRVLRRRIHQYFGVKPEIQGFSESRAKGGKVVVYELIFSINRNLGYVHRNSKPYSGNISSLDSPVVFPA